MTWIAHDPEGGRAQGEQPQRQPLGERFEIRLLATGQHGLRRVLKAGAFTRAFNAFAREAEIRPDLLITDVSSPEQAEAAVRLGREWHLPSAVLVPDGRLPATAAPRPALVRSLIGLVAGRAAMQASSAIRNATALVATSEAALGRVLDATRRERGKWEAVIPAGYRFSDGHGTDSDAEILAELGVEPGKQIVAFVGSWGPIYDLEFVLDAAREFRSHDDVQFVLAGTGAQSDRLAVPIASARNVVAPGRLSRRQIRVLLENAAVALLPYAGSAPRRVPTKLFEYMAHGTFVVSTLPGEAARLLDEHEIGVTVERGDLDTFRLSIAGGLIRAEAPGGRERIRRVFTENYEAHGADTRFAELVERIVEDAKKDPAGPSH